MRKIKHYYSGNSRDCSHNFEKMRGTILEESTTFRIVERRCQACGSYRQYLDKKDVNPAQVSMQFALA